MNTRIVLVTAGLWLLVASQVVVGLWAQLAPLSFYDDFPLPGHPWVALLPPYNEHLVRDVGGLSLALTVVLGAAAVRPDRRSTRVALVAFLVYTVPHAVFHTAHLVHFPAGDAIGQTVGFGVEIAVALAVLALSGRLPAARHPVDESGDAALRRPPRL